KDLPSFEGSIIVLSQILKENECRAATWAHWIARCDREGSITEAIVKLPQLVMPTDLLHQPGIDGTILIWAETLFPVHIYLYFPIVLHLPYYAIRKTTAIRFLRSKLANVPSGLPQCFCRIGIFAIVYPSTRRCWTPHIIEL